MVYPCKQAGASKNKGWTYWILPYRKSSPLIKADCTCDKGEYIYFLLPTVIKNYFPPLKTYKIDQDKLHGPTNATLPAPVTRSSP